MLMPAAMGSALAMTSVRAMRLATRATAERLEDGARARPGDDAGALAPPVRRGLRSAAMMFPDDVAEENVQAAERQHHEFIAVLWHQQIEHAAT